MVVIFLISISAPILAQTGLFEIEFGMPYDTAHALLFAKNFSLMSTNNYALMYMSNVNQYVYTISIILNDYRRVIGWYVMYNPSNSESDDADVLNILADMHGPGDYDGNDDIICWYLGYKKVCLAEYNTDGGLSILYIDTSYDTDKYFKFN